MKPQELYRVLNTIRRDQELDWAEMAVLVGVSEAALDGMRRGVVSGTVRELVAAYITAEVA